MVNSLDWIDKYVQYKAKVIKNSTGAHFFYIYCNKRLTLCEAAALFENQVDK